jgi:outer membrane biosynthesis protein TonB
MSGHFGLVELILVFLAVLGLAVWDLMATKRSTSDPPRVPQPQPSAPVTAEKKPKPPAAAKQPAASKPRVKPKSRAKSPPPQKA